MPRYLTALSTLVAKEQLNRAKVSRSSVDKGHLRSPQRVGAEQRRVETDAGDPFRQQAGILAGRDASVFVAATADLQIAGTLSACRQVLLDCLQTLGNLPYRDWMCGSLIYTG
jgi:hypothetical protein